jgi:hypothetical protein
MTESTLSFAAFELNGWENPDTVAAYHALAPQITTQSAQAMLDAADVTDGKRVLDIACGAGYLAQAAALRAEQGRAALQVEHQLGIGAGGEVRRGDLESASNEVLHIGSQHASRQGELAPGVGMRGLVWHGGSWSGRA